MTIVYRQFVAFIACGVILVCVFSGCSRPTPVVFAKSDAFGELPDPHQTQLAVMLDKNFGVGDSPKFPDNEDGDPIPGLEDVLDKRDLEHLLHGASVYRMRCAGCHGISGDGAGEAAEYLQPRPRDYRLGKFKFTSTPIGAKPTRADLVRTIRRGAKGTSMPSFPWMTDEDVSAVIDYVIYLSLRGETEFLYVLLADEFEEDEDLLEEEEEFAGELVRAIRSWNAGQLAVFPVTPEPAFDQASILAGREVFLSETIGCWKCHGKDAKGQMAWLSSEFLAAQEKLPVEEREQINRDAWKHVAPAADLTARMLHGGRRSIDVYRRIYTGINGTPMPAFGHVFAEEPDKVWHLVHYVLSVVDGAPVDPENQSNES